MQNNGSLEADRAEVARKNGEKDAGQALANDSYRKAQAQAWSPGTQVCAAAVLVGLACCQAQCLVMARV